MCNGKGINPSQFKYTLLNEIGADTYEFDGRNSVFANRYEELDNDTTLSFKNLREGGKYMLKLVKATANDQIRVNLTGAYNNGTGGQAFLLQGALNQEYDFHVIYDGEKIRISNVNGGDNVQVFEREVTYAANPNQVSLPLEFSDNKYFLLVDDKDGIGLDKSGIIKNADKVEITVITPAANGVVSITAIKY